MTPTPATATSAAATSAAATSTATSATATATSATATSTSTAATSAAATSATATADAMATAAIVLAAAARLHLGDDLGVVFSGERLVRVGKDRVLASHVGAVGPGEPGRRVEQGLAGGRPRVAVEISGGRGDLGLERDLRRVLGRQRGEGGGELGPPGRQPREHGAVLVDEVPRDRAREERDRLAHAIEIAVVGPARSKSPRRLQELGHHLVVAAVRSLELREAGKLHAGRIHTRPRCDKRLRSLKAGRIAC